MKTLLTFILLLLIDTVIACTCQVGTIRVNYDRASVIFYGRHIQNKYSQDVFDIKGMPLHVDNFKVIKFFKGVPTYYQDECTKDNFTISLMSYCQKGQTGFQSDCSFCFDSSNYYLVYCDRNMITGQLIPNHCSRTSKIIDNNFIITDSYDQEKGKDEAQELINLSASDSLNQNFLQFGEILKTRFDNQQNQITTISHQLDRYRFGMFLSIGGIILLTILLIKKYFQK